MELAGRKEVSFNTQKILKKFRRENNLLVHIQHIFTREGSLFFIPETFGAEIHENVKQNDHGKVFIKYYPNSFRKT